MHQKEKSEILKQWLMKRRGNPYPTPAEKEELMKKAGLKRSQLDHWFTNARQRYVRPKSRRGPNPNYSRYPASVTNILVEWLTNEENVNHPYPSVEAQAELMKKTNLTKRQLQNWFTNARKRRLAVRVMKQKSSTAVEKPSDTKKDVKTVKPATLLPKRQLSGKSESPSKKRPRVEQNSQQSELHHQQPSKVMKPTIDMSKLFCSPLLAPNLGVAESLQQQIQMNQQGLLLANFNNIMNKNLVLAAALQAQNNLGSPGSTPSNNATFPLMLNTALPPLSLQALSNMKTFRQDSPRDVSDIESIQNGSEQEAAAMMLGLVNNANAVA